MKDIKGINVQSGQKVHIFGTSKIEPNFSLDINCVVVNSRGRGVKFIDEVTTKEYLQKDIEEHQFSINVLGERIVENPKKVVKSSSSKITQEHLDTIEKLESWGWYGTLYKNVGGTKHTINISEKND